MIEIHEESGRLIHQVPFTGAAPRDGGPLKGNLDIVTYLATGLNGFAALVVTGDLQYRELVGEKPSAGRLIGQLLCEELVALSELGELPESELTGVILAGDLYCNESAQVRGASGDVGPVWDAFREDFAAVVGVAGNHDRLDSVTGQGAHILDGETVNVMGLLIGGVSGIIGQPGRALRRAEDEYLGPVEQLLHESPDALVLHESPAIDELGVRGNSRLRQVLERFNETIVICGHVHWPSPFARLHSGSRVVNVDSRCLVLVGT